MVIGSLLNALGLVLWLLAYRPDSFQKYFIAAGGVSFLAGVGSVCVNMGV